MPPTVSSGAFCFSGFLYLQNFAGVRRRFFCSSEKKYFLRRGENPPDYKNVTLLEKIKFPIGKFFFPNWKLEIL